MKFLAFLVFEISTFFENTVAKGAFAHTLLRNKELFCNRKFVIF